MTLTKRLVKGVALTAAEHDANMDHLSRGVNIKAAYEAEENTNAYTDADKIKVTGVENLADVTDSENVAAAGAAMIDVDANMTAAYSTTSANLGTKASGATTLVFFASNVQRLVNGGSFSLAPPASGEGTLLLTIVNNGTAGAIDVMAFGSVTGDNFDTTDTNQFLCSIAVVNAVSYLNILAHSGNI